MTKNEFFFSVVASLVAAVVLELAGVTQLTGYVKKQFEIPVWAILTLVFSPVLLALLWFRRYISPAHVALKFAHDQLISKVDELNDQLLHSNSEAGKLQLAFSESKAREDRLSSELKEWIERGVKLYPDDKHIQLISGQRYGPEVVDVDNKRFIRCIFEGTILRYRGVGPVQFESDTFIGIRWVFDAPVVNAFSLMSAMYASGLPELTQQMDQFVESLRNKDATPRNAGAPGVKPSGA